MSCERIQPQICWYLYNELDERERTEVEEHVEACAGCAAELERERAFLEQLAARRAIEPPAALMAACRHDLMRSVYRAERLRESVRREAGRFEWWQRAWEALGGRQTAAAVCLLAMGFFGGWALRQPSVAPSLPVATTGDAMLANISGVSLDPEGGRVQIAYDEVRRQMLSGTLEDPAIQSFLISAARSYGNPGVRLETIGILQQRAGDREVRNTLLYALANDRNAGVRLKALEGLKAFSNDTEVRRALTQVLTNDENPGMRVQAIELLTQQPDESLVGVLQDVAGKEENNYVRMRCQDVLREMNASLGTF
jgi:hypothetical protein